MTVEPKIVCDHCGSECGACVVLDTDSYYRSPNRGASASHAVYVKPLLDRPMQFCFGFDCVAAWLSERLEQKREEAEWWQACREPGVACRIREDGRMYLERGGKIIRVRGEPADPQPSPSQDQIARIREMVGEDCYDAPGVVLDIRDELGLDRKTGRFIKNPECYDE